MAALLIRHRASRALLQHLGRCERPFSSLPDSPLLPRPSQRSFFSRASPSSLTKSLPEWEGAGGVGLVAFFRRRLASESWAEKLKLGVFKKPLGMAKNTASEYRQAVGLQFEAFWKRNNLILVGAVGLAACLLLWRLMFGIASLFVSLSEGMAKIGFLALAAAMVSFGGLMLRARYTINPDKLYRITMRKLHTSASALEVLGPPLNGLDVKAYVMSGGGLRLKNLKPRLNSKRCFLIFPVQGSERRGLVSVEVKKKKGQYDFKLLAIDVATSPGAEHRIYIIGDEVEYKVGDGLISELRDPIVKAMEAQREFEEQDEEEEHAEEEREKVEAARKLEHQEEAASP